jgi:hypothetical protein
MLVRGVVGDLVPDIHNGPDRRSHPVSLSFLYFVGGKVLIVENQNVGNLSRWPGRIRLSLQ